MTVECLISPADVGLINDRRTRLGVREPFDLNQGLRWVGYRTVSAGIKNYAVDFVRGRSGLPVCGAYRVPFKLNVEGGLAVVLKPYQHKQPSREIRVIQMAGDLPPRVSHFGNDFYVENWVDVLNSESLLEMAKRGKREEAIAIGARTHAKLAKRRVNYNHHHWTDEFFVSPEGVYVLDFGTSYPFMAAGDGAGFNRELRILKKRGLRSLFQSYGYIPSFGELMLYEDKLSAHLESRVDRPEEVVNLLEVLSLAFMGIERNEEDLGERYPCETAAFERFPVFVDEFFKEYSR